MSYVKVSGTGFILDNKPWFPIGGTSYDALGPNPWNNSHIYDLVDDCINGKFTSIRFIDFFPTNNGSYDPTQEVVWTPIDYGLDQCRKYGIKVLLDLSNYRDLLISGSTNPYTYDWTSFLTFVTGRVNTINGYIYRNDDTIWSYSLAGEPYHQSNSIYSLSDMNNFYAIVSKLLKSLDSNHLISAGGFNHVPNSDTNPDYTNIWGSTDIDYCAIHPYQGTGHNPVQPNSELISLYNTSSGLNKPLIIEEIGFNQNSCESDRANFVRLLYNEAVGNNLVGYTMWNLGKEISPGSFDYHYSTSPIIWKTMKSMNFLGTIARIPI